MDERGPPPTSSHADTSGASTSEVQAEERFEFECNVDAQLPEDADKLSARARREAKVRLREERRVAHWQHRRERARERKRELQRLEREAVARGEEPPERRRKNPRIRTSVPLGKHWPRLVIDLDFQDCLSPKVRLCVKYLFTFSWHFIPTRDLLIRL